MRRVQLPKLSLFIVCTWSFLCACDSPKNAEPSEAQKSVTPNPVKRPAPLEASDRVVEARALVEKFKGVLQSGLREAIKKGGPASAIEACSEMAPQFAKATQSEHLRLKRVGTRVRGLKQGVASAEEAAVLETLSDRNREHVYENGDEFRYMQAIMVDRGLCLVCHGAPSAIPDDVKAALAERYPEDQAVGYALGDLRGAFVVYNKPKDAPKTP
ncbi:MAG: DUF3365 domain-containing protein [Myxococcota bacterium]